MKRLISMLSLVVLWPLAASWAQAPVLQYPPPNEAGAAMGHLHLNTGDVEANKKFWTALGGTPMKVGQFEVSQIPGVYVYLHLAAGAQPSSGGMVGTVVNHIGFRVQNTEQAVARWKAAGLKLGPGRIPGQAYVYSPDDMRIEILEDKSLTVPMAMHHIHFYVAEAAIPEIQAWYAKMFGAKPGMRGQNQAADLPGVNLTFSKSDTPTVGTKGRLLDHIGFEVKNLEAYCKKLEAGGMKFDRPYSKNPQTGVGIAFFTDPWGTYIELNEH